MFRCSVYTTTTPYCIKRRAPVKSFLKTYNLVSQASLLMFDQPTMARQLLNDHYRHIMASLLWFQQFMISAGPRGQCAFAIYIIPEANGDSQSFVRFPAPCINRDLTQTHFHTHSQHTVDQCGLQMAAAIANRNCQVFDPEWSSPDAPASVFGSQRPPYT